MKAIWRALLIVVIILALCILVGPFLVPVPPLQDTVPAEQLADADSQFLHLNGLNVHMKTAGHGEPVLILLHGFGASLFSWREVMTPLADAGYRVVAFDRPAYGLTSRPMPEEWEGPNPYTPEAQVELTIAILDALGVSQAVLVGNSAGGSIAALTALQYPERVQALVLVDAAIYTSGGVPSWLRPLLHTPQARRLGPLISRSFAQRGSELIRSAWYDASKITPDVIAGYTKPLRAENWDRALWEATLASHPLQLSARLKDITQPTLVITGDSDTWVPTEQSVRLAGELPHATLAIMPHCGHVPQEECPEPFLEALLDFLDGLSP